MSRISIVILALLAILSWWGSGLEYAMVAGHLNGLAPDGQVESYTPAFHGQIQSNLRWFAGLATVVAVLLLLARWRFGHLIPEVFGTGALGSFRTDLLDMLHRYTKRTSTDHKRFVLLLILVGTVLRGWMLFEPVTYDEAFTLTYYATRPFHVIIADHSYPNNHILHTLLVKLSTKVFGVGLVSLRLPAFLAGVLVMPVFYLFVRGMFNRYIAVLSLALVAGSGALIEYSALGRGYSITWLCLMVAFALGRHFTKENNAVSALLISLVLALGMWSVPTMIYSALMVYIWLFLHISFRYKGTKAARLRLLVLSGLVFGGLTVLLYLPVLLVYGFGQFFHHDTMPDNTWDAFQEGHVESALDLWTYLVATVTPWMAFLGVAGFLFAGYVSARFRSLVAAMALGAIPLVILQLMVAPSRAWLYILFVMHLSTGIALFYLLKAVQEKALPNLGKRVRTVWAGLILLAGTGYTAMRALPERIDRFPEAAVAAQYLADATEPGDRVYVDFPWEAPLEFHCIALRMDRTLLHLPPRPGGLVFVFTSPAYHHTIESVLRHHNVAPTDFGGMKVVLDHERSVIFAAPFGEEQTR